MGASNLGRLLHPATNPAGYMTTAGTIYAAVVMIWNAYNHHGVISAPVIIAAAGAVASLLARQVVTPVADPKDGNGNPLVAAPVTAPVPPAVPPSGNVRIVSPVPADGDAPPGTPPPPP